MDPILLEGTVRPITGYLLCYIPLATVVIGLITLFVLTDRHASRPYLRYNPFVAAGSSEKELAARPPAVGETPAGPLGGAVPAGQTTVFLGEHGATATVPKAAVPPPAAPDRAPALSGEPPMDVPKDLGLVTGVDLPNVDQRPSAPPAAGAAVAQGLAITYIEFNPAGSDLEGEYVRISNGTTSPVDLTGCTLRDQGQKHSFTFPRCTLAPGAELRLWSKSGQNDAANLYWGQRGAIWNNTGDTAVLLDKAGLELSRFSYEGKRRG